MEKSRRTLTLSLAAVAGLALTGLAAPAAAQSITVPVAVVSHNVEKRQNVINQALQKASNIGAQAIALQEVCQSQLDALRAEHRGWTIAAAGKLALNANCPTPQRVYSVAIWTGGGGGVTDAYDELVPGQPGDMACVKYERSSVPVHLCSVHLTAYEGEELRTQQATKIKQISAEWWAGTKNHFGILAGDFNTNPFKASIDKIYDSRVGTGGTGGFTEYNRSGNGRGGRSTTDKDRQIDYVFFSTNRAQLHDGPAVGITPTDSDHHMLASKADMRL